MTLLVEEFGREEDWTIAGRPEEMLPRRRECMTAIAETLEGVRDKLMRASHGMGIVLSERSRRRNGR